jgi:fibronectin-binding autotransporter adhesin
MGFIVKLFRPALTLILVVNLSLNQLQLQAQRQMEQLNRGVVAVKVSGGVYVSWRVLGNEWKDVSYNIYRESTKLNTEPITGASCWSDPYGTTESTYSVAAVINNIEQPASSPVDVWGTNYKNIPLQIPAGGTTPDGVNYTYNANDCSVGDLDGDGDYEIVLKWDPSNSKDNSQSGYTGNVYLDAYELDGTHLWRIDLGRNIRAGAHYTQFMVYDLDGDGKSEIACKTADATIDGTGVIIGNASADYRNASGYILSGPEYLTIFDGETGKALVTTAYEPPRGTVSSWGDSYGNRVDRFLACVAYLDGKRPSLVMCRGYYTRTVLVAWDWRDSTLTKRWVFDTNNGYSDYRGQGNHNLSVADVDEDGKDEIIYGACAIDDDGTGLWTTGLGHGDAMHVSDIDITRPGLEKWGIHEGTNNPGSALLDARTGEIIWKTANADVGRGVSADLTAAFPGMECWGGTTGLRSSTNKYAGSSPSSSNFVIWWDGDDLRELLDATSIDKYNGDLLLFATGCLSNNGTKSTPCLQADILGDWREEVIFRLADNTALRIYVSAITTQRRLYTLMHDPQYRLSIAWQNVAYNQPPHTGFFLGYGMDVPPPPPVYRSKLTWKAGLTWDLETSKNWLCNDTLAWFSNGNDVLFDISGSNINPIELNGSLFPSNVTVYSPTDYIFEGSGSLSGSMGLLKAGSGTLTLNSDYNYSGKTEVWGGTLMVNGSLSQSSVEVNRSATIGGAGIFGKGLTIRKQGNLIVGPSSGSADTLRVSQYLNQEGRVNMYFDLSGDTSGVTRKNDILIVDGDLNLTDTNSININMLEGYLNPGTYTLIKYSGNFNNTIDNFILNGLTGVANELREINGAIELFVFKVRDPQSLVWAGTSGNVWDLAKTKNWLNGDIHDWFVTNDTVLFDDSAVITDIKLTGNLPIGKMSVNASVNYSFSGSGSVCGTTGIVKTGTGKLKITSKNNYSGPTIINGGILEIPGFTNSGISGPIGASTSDPSNLVINNSAVYVTGEISETDRGITIGEAWGTINTRDPDADIVINGQITGSGKLNKTGTGRLTLSGNNTYTGGTYLKEGRIYLGNDSANIRGLGTGLVTIENGTLEMFDYTNSIAYDCYWDMIIPEGANASLKLGSRCALTGSLTGSGTLNIYTPYIRAELLGDWSGFNGNVNVTTDNDGGTFIPGNNKGYGGASVNLAKNVTMIYRHTESDTIDIGDLSGVTESVLGAGGEGTATITWRIGSGNSNSTFNGQINEVQFKNSGAKTSIIKTGTGTWTLTNANTYSGGTLVEKGMLLVKNTSGSGTGTGQVDVGNAATLSGNGSIAGPVTIQSGGAVSVNTSDIGIFTVNNDLILQPGSYCCIDLNPVEKTSDRLLISGKMRLSGILYLINASNGSYSAGDSFRIFETSACSGTFELIAPLSPGKGLQWDTTGLCSTGYIHIIESPVSVKEEFQDGIVKIYPNPSSQKVYISVEDRAITSTAKDISLRCYNELGILCDNQIIPILGNSSVIEYDLRKLGPGIYVIVINIDGHSYTRKLIKK